MLYSVATLTARPVLQFTSAEVSEAMNRSFEGYFVPMHFDAASFERRFRGEHLDPAASRLWFCGEELVGVVFIARRGWTARLAAMGLVPAARGQGLGKPMLQTAIDEAIARGDRSILLEVFTANQPAIRLYERLGFQITRQLRGYSNSPTQVITTTDQLTEVDPQVVARLVVQEGFPDLPWMIAGETLAALAAPVQAFHLQERAFALVRPEAERTILITLIVRESARRQGLATRLIRALEAQFPHKPLATLIQIPPGASQELLLRCGWQEQSLQLFEMERTLTQELA